MKIDVPLALLTLALFGCDTSSGAPAPSGSASPGTTGSTLPADAAPQIAAVEPVFQFGKVKKGTVVEHVFLVRNVGTAPLRIERAKGS